MISPNLSTGLIRPTMLTMSPGPSRTSEGQPKSAKMTNFSIAAIMNSNSREKERINSHNCKSLHSLSTYN
jgi:hypothetical protein